MVRIIPWSLPPIAGGSQGGYTPAPEDVPVTPSYYDVDNVSIIRSPVYGSKATRLRVTLSGIVPDNLVGIASASLIVQQCSDPINQASADTSNVSDKVVALTVAQILDPNGTYDVLLEDSQKWFSVRKISFVLYDGNGAILTSYTFTEDLDGQQ